MALWTKAKLSIKKKRVSPTHQHHFLGGCISSPATSPASAGTVSPEHPERSRCVLSSAGKAKGSVNCRMVLIKAIWDVTNFWSAKVKQTRDRITTEKKTTQTRKLKWIQLLMFPNVSVQGTAGQWDQSTAQLSNCLLKPKHTRPLQHAIISCRLCIYVWRRSPGSACSGILQRCSVGQC